MARLIRNASGRYAKRSVPGRWGVYKGEVNVGGSRLTGYIARPPRVKAPITDAGIERSRFINGKGKVKDPTKVVNLDRPRILLIELPHADYQPIMQRPFESAVAEARRAIPDLMAAELANNIRHAGRKATDARIATLKAQLDAANARGDITRAAHISQEMSRIYRANSIKR